MSRVIALEGPDLTGKTTLLGALQKRLPYAMWPVLSIHYTKKILLEPGGATINRAMEAFYSSVATMSKTMPALLDRCYVSDYVYGRVFGREVDLDSIKWVARQLRPRIVYLYTPVEVLLERLKWRGDDFVSAKTLTGVYEGYQAWYQDNPFDDEVVKICTVGTTLEDLVDEIAMRVTE